VGVGTVIADDPDLTCRLHGMMHLSPIRIIIDTHLDTPPSARVIETAAKVPTWILTADDAPLDRETNLTREGVHIIRVQKDQKGHVDIKAAMRKLAEIGITRIFSEGGPTLAEALVVHHLVDCVEIITSPEALGRAGTVALRPGLKSALADRKLFVSTPPHLVGRDHVQYFERVR
jgi:diaminohydroxyphosphoribosylaminopyrimidine deaminase/5-amino-6-(5-phosphoribosylamino)uracil reductase